MAIIYGKDRETDYASGNLAPIGKSYSRMGAAPLDMYEVWYDKEALIAYASNLGTPQADGSYDTSSVLSYVGQKVAYVDEQNKKIFHYSIELDGTLKEIGSTFLEGALIDISAANAKGEVTISHEQVAAPTIVTGTGRTYITNVETDGYGHITKIYTATESDQEVPAVLEGTYIDVTVNDDGDYVVSHENAPTLSVTNADTAVARFITEITRDDQGHITGYKTEKVLIPDVSLDGASIARIPEGKDGAGKIEIKGFSEAAVLTLPQKKADGTGIEWVTVDAVIEGAENTITVGDGTSITASAATVEGGDIVLEIKGVRESDNAGKILSTDGKGNVTWVVDQDTDTKTGVKAGNLGVEVELQETPDTGDDRTYVVSHKAKPNNKDDDFDVNNVASQETKGNSGTYVTDVIIDEFGHVAGVHKATDLDTKYDLKLGETVTDTNGVAVAYDPYLNLVEDGTVKAHINISGHGGTKVLGTSGATIEDQELIIMAPELTLKKDEKWWDDLPEDQIPDTVNVVSYDHMYAQFVDGEDVNEANKHQLAIEKMVVPTKKYVDRLVSGATSYLGTVANEAQLKALNPEKGDFVRVSEPFNGYHASDMLICETPKAEGVDATWSLIHGEIDTDTDTWRANTKDADGYVKAPKDDEGNYLTNKVWKTDADGNPGWREDKDTTYTADEASLTLDETEFSIKDGGVSTAKIADKAVTTEKIADKAVTTTKLSDEVNASLAKADTAVQPGDLPVVNDGKFTVSGTGYLTGSGEMTANQAGDTTATLDLTADAKAKIDNAMPKLPEAERAGAEGHYAMFDKNGQVVDGGYVAALTDVLNTRDSEGTYEGQDGYLEFKIYEKLQDNDEQLLSYKLAVNKNSGLKLNQTDNSPYIYDENNLTAEQGASVYGELELSDATKASLEKADTAIQQIEFTELAEPENDGCSTVDNDSGLYSTGFRVQIHKGQGSDAEVTHYEFKIDTVSQDGIIFSPNASATYPDETKTYTSISLAPWAKDRILDSVTEVATTANQGLKTTTTYTYYDEAQEKEVTSTTEPIGHDIVDYTKKTTIDIDESVTFILNCGSAADLL